MPERHQDFGRRPLARLASAFHETLRIERAVLAREMEVAHGFSLRSPDRGPLAGQITGVAAARVAKRRPMKARFLGLQSRNTGIDARRPPPPRRGSRAGSGLFPRRAPRSRRAPVRSAAIVVRCAGNAGERSGEVWVPSEARAYAGPARAKR